MWAPIFLSFAGKVVTRSRFPTLDVPQCWRSSREEGRLAATFLLFLSQTSRDRLGDHPIGNATH